MVADRIAAFFKRLNPFFRRRLEKDLEEEMSFHLAMRAEKHRGLSVDDARHAARRRFGNPALIREKCREAWTMGFLEILAVDVKYAVRTLIRHRAFGGIAVLTLATGIAANTATFSILYSVLLKPLSYPEPQELVAVFEKRPREGVMRNVVAPGDFVQWREQAKSFSAMAALEYFGVTYAGSEEPEQIRAAAVSPDFFRVAGLRPALGREFTAEEETPGKASVVIATHAFWKRQLGGDRNAVGKTLMLTGRPMTLIGVLPENFWYPVPEVALLIPLAIGNDERTNHGSHYLSVIARLKPGASYEQAATEMDLISARMESAKIVPAGHFANLVPLQESLIGDVSKAIVFMSYAAAVLLLIACINAANLFLARSIARSREWRIRSSIGAGRARLVRQVMAEAAVTSGVATLIGVSLAHVALESVKAPLARSLQFSLPADLSISAPVLAFAALSSIVAAMLFGIVPAVRTAGSAKPLAVRVTSAAGIQGRAIKRTFVIAEVALATLLAGCTALLVRSFVEVSNTDPGFQSDSVVKAHIPLPSNRYREASQVRSFTDALLNRVESAPGITSAGVISHLPISGQDGRMGFVIEKIPPTPKVPRRAHFRIASAGYFETMRIPLRKGRLFSRADTPDSPPAMIINETAVRRHFGENDPVGMRARFVNSQLWREIVGVVGDVRHQGLEREPQPEAYLCSAQEPTWTMNLVARTTSDPEHALSALRSQVREIDRGQVIVAPATLDSLIDESTSYRRLYTSLVGLFAFAALLLAGAGAYGVIAYLVSSRTAELGVRMALGARPADILRSVVGEAGVAALAGVICGSLALLAAKPLLDGLLFGVTAHDATSLLSTDLLLLGIAMGAAWGPARRAARLDPSAALRAE